MKINSLVFLFGLLAVVSCSQIVDSYIENRERENYVSPYKGVYLGSYTGPVSGTLRLEVGAKDYVTVTRDVSGSQFSETFNGNLSGSSLLGVRSQSSGFILEGGLAQQVGGGSAGNWKQAGNSGTWTLKKQ